MTISIKIKLRKFEKADIPRLIRWIPDARFLLQWAGPQYKWPLDASQILTTLEKTTEEKPSHFMFAALHHADEIVIGHIELMSVDYGKKTALLGRVLVGSPECRGRGYGAMIVAEALNFGFNTLDLREIRLGVFDFNHSALSCYRKLGFIQYEFRRNARQIENERWNLIMMKLDRESWTMLSGSGR